MMISNLVQAKLEKTITAEQLTDIMSNNINDSHIKDFSLIHAFDIETMAKELNERSSEGE